MATGHDANYDTACMLLGMMSFLMLFLYGLNTRDKDLNKYCWKMVSSTMCTLASVSVSSTWKGLLRWLTDVKTGGRDLLEFDASVFLVWYILMQLSYLVLLLHMHSHETMDHWKLKLEFWTPLLSILVGCNSMPVWATLQSYVVGRYAESVEVAFAMVFVCALLMLALLLFMGKLRQLYIARDGIDAREREWNKCINSAEDKVVCMGLSHIIVQAVRLKMMGAMPLPDGALPMGTSASVDDGKHLLGVSLVFTAAMMLMLLLPKNRVLQGIQGTLTNCITWCWLYGGMWLVQDINGSEVVGRTVNCFGASALGAVVIIALDFVRDRDCTGECCDNEIEALISPISLWIGWNWKLAFSSAFSLICSRNHVLPQPLEMFILSTLFLAIIIPGWRWYILPVVHLGGSAGIVLVQHADGSPAKQDSEKMCSKQPTRQGLWSSLSSRWRTQEQACNSFREAISPARRVDFAINHMSEQPISAEYQCSPQDSTGSGVSPSQRIPHHTEYQPLPKDSRRTGISPSRSMSEQSISVEYQPSPKSPRHAEYQPLPRDFAGIGVSPSRSISEQPISAEYRPLQGDYSAIKNSVSATDQCRQLELKMRAIMLLSGASDHMSDGHATSHPPVLHMSDANTRALNRQTWDDRHDDKEFAR